MTTARTNVDPNSMAGPRDEAFVRLVEQMRQYFSLADFLPVGEDAVCPVGDLTVRARGTPVSSPAC